MDEQGVLERMRQGAELRNHGKGWWLAPPLGARRHEDAQPVEQRVVTALEQKGLIRVSIPYTSAVAELVIGATEPKASAAAGE